jgi:transposase-like protein
METKKQTSNKFSPEVRARAVRMVQEHRGDHASQWAAIASIAAKIGCAGETLRNWVRQAQRDAGVRPGSTTDERERIKALEHVPKKLTDFFDENILQPFEIK